MYKLSPFQQASPNLIEECFQQALYKSYHISERLCSISTQFLSSHLLSCFLQYEQTALVLESKEGGNGLYLNLKEKSTLSYSSGGVLTTSISDLPFDTSQRVL